MSILEKLKILKVCSDKNNSCNVEGQPKCKYSGFIFCWIKKILTVMVSLAILSPIIAHFVAPRIIHKYLINNPEVIIESVQKYSERKQQEMQAGSTQKVQEIYSEAISNSNIPFLGNKNGSHIAVVFYDYSCGYCKKAANELRQLSKKDSQLKILLKDLPLFGATSISAAKASMYVYAKHPEKFEDFHYKLIMTKDINDNTINAVAKSVGIKEDITKESKSSYENELRSNYVQAGEIRVDGTPAIIINGKLSLGYKSVDEIAKMFY